MADRIGRRELFLSGFCWLGALLIDPRSIVANEEQSLSEDESGADGFPVSAYPLYKRYYQGDLHGEISADRRLSRKDLELLLELSDYLVDERHRWVKREHAAKQLGWFGHKYAIPPLLAVMRDQQERPGLRRRCAYALMLIRDKRVVSYMIEDGLASDNIQLRQSTVWFYLPQFADYPPELADKSFAAGYELPPEDLEKREEYLDIWRKWWKENRDEIELNRTDRGTY